MASFENCGLFYSEQKITLYFVDFEWDEEKNKRNIRKRGFDFADAWEILKLRCERLLTCEKIMAKSVGKESAFLETELSS